MTTSLLNNTLVFQATLLVLFILIFLPLGSTRTGPGIRTNVGPGAAPVISTPAIPAQEKKPNVGAVVGFTLLLVAVLVAAFVCVYRSRRSATTKYGHGKRHEVFAPPGMPVRIDEEEKHEAQVLGNGELGDKKNNGVGEKERDKERLQRPDTKEVVGGKERDKEKNLCPNPQEVVGRKERGKERNKQLDPKEGLDEKPRGKVEINQRPGRQEVAGQKERGKERNQRPDPQEIVGQKEKGKERNQRPDQQNVVGQKERLKERNQKPDPPEDIKAVGKDQRGKERGDKVGKRNKRGREASPQRPLSDEDEGGHRKRGKDEGNQQFYKEDVQRQREKVADGKKPQELVQEGLPNKYPYSYLKSVTNKFNPNNKIGRGGFGRVYRGTLWNGTMVAVKCLKFGGVIDDFQNEVEALSRANHSNLVKLIGYCADGITRMLVYEYMRNGSLDKWIFHTKSRKFLTWPEMKNVIHGIARGLVYLHEKCDKKILHRDLKPSNVVLDEDKNAKLCDFGLAKLLNKDQTSTSTNWAGTRGYMAPEIMKNHRITDKVDVYSFGVVLLEVIFGKRYHYLVSSDHNNNTQEVNLHDLIKNLSEDMRRNGKEIEQFGNLAMLCLREKPEERPTMSVVLVAIQGIEKKFKEAKARRN